LNSITPEQARCRQSTARRHLTVAFVMSVVVVLVAIYGLTGGFVPTNSVLSSASLNQPISPDAMVVDASTRHIFVATAALYTSSPSMRNLPRSRLNIFDTRTGALQRVRAFGTGLAVLALDERAGRVFLADGSVTRRNGGTMYALDATTGDARRSVPISMAPTAIGMDPLTNRLFVAGEGARVCTQKRCSAHPPVVQIFDAQALHLLRTTPIGPFPQRVIVDAGSGRIFVTGAQGVDILDATTGLAIAAVPNVLDILAIDQRTHRVFAMDARGRVRMFNDMDGRPLGMVRFRGMPPFGEGNPAATDDVTGNVLILDSGRRTLGGPLVRPGGVGIVDGTDGHIVRTIRLGRIGTSPSAIVVDPAGQHAFIADMFANTVIILDMRQGRVQRAIPVGSAPKYLALDGRTGHLAVEEIGAPSFNSKQPDAWAWIPPALRSVLPFVPHQRPSAPTMLPSASVTVLDPIHH